MRCIHKLGMCKRQRRNEEDMERATFFILFTVCTVLFIIFCITDTVLYGDRAGIREEELYYSGLEERLVTDTRSFLTAAGFENSGVNLKRVVDEEGKREYTLIIHHRRIDSMDEEQREELRRKLDSMVNTSEICIFCHEFLVLN